MEDCEDRQYGLGVAAIFRRSVGGAITRGGTMYEGEVP